MVPSFGVMSFLPAEDAPEPSVSAAEVAGNQRKKRGSAAGGK